MCVDIYSPMRVLAASALPSTTAWMSGVQPSSSASSTCTLELRRNAEQGTRQYLLISTNIYWYLTLVSPTPPCNPLISSEFKYPRIARSENPATMPSSSCWKRSNEQTIHRELRTIHAFASSWFRNIVISIFGPLYSLCPLTPYPKHSQLSGWH